MEAKGLQWIEKTHKNISDAFFRDQRILSFEEYIHILEKDKEQQLRSSAQYMRDMIDHFGTNEDGSFRLFDQEFVNPEFKLIGLKNIQEKIYKILNIFIEEGANNKLILLHGSNGSAKSSLISCIIRGLEHYSQQEEGSSYRFHWIFPIDSYGKPSFGLSQEKRMESDIESYAKLSDDEISCRISCDLKDHPLFLFPEKERTEMIDSLNLAKDFKISEYIKKGQLSYKSRIVYEALLRNYKGDYKKVLKHIQVERFYISKRYRESAITIEPQMHIDATSQQFMTDRSLQSLPIALSYLNLTKISGDLIDGNRGIVEYNDLLKRPIDSFKYLLSTCETGAVSLPEVNAFIDTILIGTCNELQLDAFKEYPDFTSFKARIELVQTPYLLKFTEEEKIYQTQINRIAGKHYVAPHTLKLAALWAVLCRLKKPDTRHYHSKITYLINSLTPIEKAYFYNDVTIPSRFSREEKNLIRSNMEDIIKEFKEDPNYEGRVGPSPREMKLILSHAIDYNKHKILSPVGLFDALKDFVTRTSEYNYLKTTIVDGYYDANGFIQKITQLYLDTIDNEIKDSIGMYHEDQFENFLNNYIINISSYLKNEKIKNPTTGKNEDPNENLMEEFENIIGIKDNKKKFREDIITQIAIHSLEKSNPKEKTNYKQIFSELIKKIKDHYYDEQKNLITHVYDSLSWYLEKENRGKATEATEQEKYKKITEDMMKNMESRYGYTATATKEAFGFLKQKRY